MWDCSQDTGECAPVFGELKAGWRKAATLEGAGDSPPMLAS